MIFEPGPVVLGPSAQIGAEHMPFFRGGRSYAPSFPKLAQQEKF